MADNFLGDFLSQTCFVPLFFIHFAYELFLALFSLNQSVFTKLLKRELRKSLSKFTFTSTKADVRNHRYLSSLISDVENIQYTVLLFWGITGQIWVVFNSIALNQVIGLRSGIFWRMGLRWRNMNIMISSIKGIILHGYESKISQAFFKRCIVSIEVLWRAWVRSRFSMKNLP